MRVLVRPITKEDWHSIAGIYRQGIETGNATFETEIPTWEKWDSAHLESCRIVAVCDNDIAGWAALVPVSARRVYSGVAEVSIYIADKYRGMKIGSRLLEMLIKQSEIEGFWTLQAVIFPENIASIRMHQNLGFRQVGYREKIGKMNGKWRNTILLERRSRITDK